MNIDSRFKIESAQKATKRAATAIYQLRVRLLRDAKTGKSIDAAVTEWALDSIDEELRDALEDMEQAVVLDDTKGAAE